MPRKDITTTLKNQIALNVAAITTSTTTVGNIIDTADYNGGVNFTAFLGVRTDGTFTPLIEDGDVSNLSDAAAVDDAYLVKQNPSLTTAPEAQAVLNTSNGISKIGYIGAKRYVRLSLVSTTVTSGAAAAGAIVEKSADVQPAL